MHGDTAVHGRARFVCRRRAASTGHWQSRASRRKPDEGTIDGLLRSRTTPAGISCRSPARPTCRTACCARSTTRRSTIAARISAGWAWRSWPISGRSSRPTGPVMIYPASGTGAWEAALANTLSPGDRVLMCRTGWFATLWNEMALRLDLKPIFIETDWRRGADVAAIGAALRGRQGASHQGGLRGAQRDLDRLHVAHRRGASRDGRRAHPALLMVDTISSLASIDYRHDEWGVDVTVAGSQKGLMLPPGLSFNAISDEGAESHRDGAACRAATGTGGRCWRRTRPAISLTRPAPTCCSA